MSTRPKPPATASPSGWSWWYVLVLTPMVASLVVVVGLAVVTVALVTARADLSTYGPAYFALFLMGVPLVVLYPLALYRDARLVADLDVDWSPDPRRYGAAGALAVATLLVLSIPLSWQYLRQRRRHLDRP